MMTLKPVMDSGKEPPLAMAVGTSLMKESALLRVAFVIKQELAIALGGEQRFPRCGVSLAHLCQGWPTTGAARWDVASAEREAVSSRGTQRALRSPAFDADR